jgi:hypothetical protein
LSAIAKNEKESELPATDEKVLREVVSRGMKMAHEREEFL